MAQIRINVTDEEHARIKAACAVKQEFMSDVGSRLLLAYADGTIPEVERLREALNHIEWAAPPSPAVCVPFCPWCGTIEEEGHRFDCMRQAALEPQKGAGDE